MKKVETDEYIRVDRRDAENYYKAGFTVSLLPCKMRLNNPWCLFYSLPLNKDFDKIVFDYVRNNCSHEVGYYPSYYISRKELFKNEECKD